jgi:hypothetical protein
MTTRKFLTLTAHFIFTTDKKVIGGTDSHGEKVYVGRVKQNGFLLPGKIVPSHNCCYVAYDGVEVGSSKYQVAHSFSLSVIHQCSAILNTEVWIVKI